MTIQEELQLSYYKQISTLNASHNVFLVQHIETGKLYVKKILSVYDKAVYDQLCKYPLENTPRIYAVVKDDSQLIIIEEYINGETLEEIVQLLSVHHSPRYKAIKCHCHQRWYYKAAGYERCQIL